MCNIRIYEYLYYNIKSLIFVIIYCQVSALNQLNLVDIFKLNKPTDIFKQVKIEYKSKM